MLKKLIQGEQACHRAPNFAKLHVSKETNMLQVSVCEVKDKWSFLLTNCWGAPCDGLAFHLSRGSSFVVSYTVEVKQSLSCLGFLWTDYRFSYILIKSLKVPSVSKSQLQLLL